MNRKFILITFVVFSLAMPVHFCFAGAAQVQQQKKAIMQKRQQAIVAQQQAVMQQMMRQEINQVQAAKQIQAQKQAQVQAQMKINGMTGASPSMKSNVPQEDITVVEPNELFAALEHSSHVWSQIIDAPVKIFVVQEYIKKFYAEKGIKIRRTASHYAALVDELSRQSPEMLDSPFENILQFLAIMEYDFDNGQNPDALAKQVLSEEAYKQNRKRLGAPE